MQTTQLGSMFKSPAQAEQWLQMFSRNGLTMMGLRDVAAKCGLGSANTSDNGTILKLLALQIYSGHLRICSMGSMGGAAGVNSGAMGGSWRSGTTAGGGDDSKPFPISERQKPSSSAPDEPPPDPSTFSDDLDGSTQASALTSAATDGQPFCPE